MRIGKRRVEQRIHALNRRLKAGLASMSHVTLITPRSDALSAGLVCFAVDRLSPDAVVEALRPAPHHRDGDAVQPALRAARPGS